MRNILLLFVIFVFFMAGCASQNRDTNRQPHIGTAWNFGGYLVTNYHVINPTADNIDELNKTDIFIFYKGNTQKAKIVYYDIAYDICILSVDDIDNAPPQLLMSLSVPNPGDFVYSVGFPNAMIYGFTPKYLPGYVSAILRHKNGPSSFSLDFGASTILTESSFYQNKKYPESYIMTTIQAILGNSGGPVFSKDGYVVGIMSASDIGEVDNILPAQYRKKLNNSYVIPIKYCKSVFARVPAQTKHEQTLDHLATLVDKKISPEDTVALVITISNKVSDRDKGIIHNLLSNLEKSFANPY